MAVKTNTTNPKNLKKSGESDFKEISFSQELLRKGIHFVSFSIPIGYYYASKELAYTILIPITIVFLIIDVFGRKKTIVQKLLHKYFGGMLRSHEFEDKLILNGASWVLLSAMLCIAIFPKIIVVTAFAVLILSDSSAAIFGRLYGKHKYYHKSYEGSLAFFIAGILVVFYIAITNSMPWTFYAIGAFAVLVGTLVEAISSSIIKIDDNLTIPLSISCVLWAGNHLAILLGASYL